jgi:hypothetical protein
MMLYIFPKQKNTPQARSVFITNQPKCNELFLESNQLC